MRTCIIIGAFKVISVQALNIKAYLTSIGLELDKKTDQTITQLYLNPLFSIIIQNWSVYATQLPTTLKILENYHIKLLKNSISELEKKPVYITTL